jgi:hypothetical protein
LWNHFDSLSGAKKAAMARGTGQAHWTAYAMRQPQLPSMFRAARSTEAIVSASFQLQASIHSSPPEAMKEPMPQHIEMNEVE